MVSIDHFSQMCLFQKLRPSEEWLKNHSCLKIEDHKELPNADTKLVQVGLILKSPFGYPGFYRVFNVQAVSLSSEEINERQQGLENAQRTVRDELLKGKQ